MITPAGYEITSSPAAEPDFRPSTVDWDLAAAEKGGYRHFMDKEIAEQPARWPTPCSATSTAPASCSTSSG